MDQENENSMINRNDFSVKTIKTTIETLKTIEDCANYKDKEVGRNSFDEFRKLIGTKHDLVKIYLKQILD